MRISRSNESLKCKNFIEPTFPYHAMMIILVIQYGNGVVYIHRAGWIWNIIPLLLEDYMKLAKNMIIMYKVMWKVFPPPFAPALMSVRDRQKERNEWFGQNDNKSQIVEENDSYILAYQSRRASLHKHVSYLQTHNFAITILPTLWKNQLFVLHFLLRLSAAKLETYFCLFKYTRQQGGNAH